MEYTYYPGCSLTGTAKEYDDSIRQVFDALGIGLRELEDWNCCGASSAHVTDDELAIALAARNLALADKVGLDILVPCAACFNRLKFAEKELLADEEKWIGQKYSGKLRILHVNDALAEPTVLNRIKARVSKPLSDLAVVPYYGCLTVRPPKVTDIPDYEDPKGMDKILTVLGADMKKWSYKTDCCGGSLVLTMTDAVRRLTDRLFDAAVEAGASAMVTDCPMCQSNLDTRQAEINKLMGRSYSIPVFYITELIILAMDQGALSKQWSKHFVDPQPLLSSIGR